MWDPQNRLRFRNMATLINRSGNKDRKKIQKKWNVFHIDFYTIQCIFIVFHIDVSQLYKNLTAPGNNKNNKIKHCMLIYEFHSNYQNFKQEKLYI